MRLFDADKLQVKHYLQRSEHPIGYEGTQAVYNYTDVLAYDIESAETVEAEPVRHGHWEKLHKTYGEDVDCGDYDWRCSECGKVDCHNIKVEVPYCWHCGAKMDEER